MSDNQAKTAMVNRLAEEVESQLQNDILSYSWLVGITATTFPELEFDERADLLVRSLDVLLKKLKINIGPTKSVDSVLHVESWAEAHDDRIRLLREFIKKHGAPSRESDFLFWVGLPVSENK